MCFHNVLYRRRPSPEHCETVRRFDSSSGVPVMTLTLATLTVKVRRQVANMNTTTKAARLTITIPAPVLALSARVCPRGPGGNVNYTVGCTVSYIYGQFGPWHLIYSQ